MLSSAFIGTFLAGIGLSLFTLVINPFHIPSLFPNWFTLLLRPPDPSVSGRIRKQRASFDKQRAQFAVKQRRTALSILRRRALLLATVGAPILASQAIITSPSSFLSTKQKLSERQLLSIQQLVTDVHSDASTFESKFSTIVGFDLIVDSGCSFSVSSVADDFEPGSLEKLKTPFQLSGIAGNLTATHKGILRYELIDDDNEVVTIRCEGYLLPSLPVRLLSPQQLLHMPNTDTWSLGIYRNRAVLHCGTRNGRPISVTIAYQGTSGLPVIRAYKDAMSTAHSLFSGSLFDPDNGNLSSNQQRLLDWHCRWGHVNMSLCQWLGRTGILGRVGVDMGKTSVIAPHCTACHLAKQSRTPTAGTTTRPNHESGTLSKDQLAPGDLIYTDQYESRLEGHIFNPRGRHTSKTGYRGGTLFCDAASSRIFVANQVSLTGVETVQAKLTFEREAAAAGVSIKKYRSDNGIYAASDFSKELEQRSQTITFSGVGGHHHNGTAENAIKFTMQRARSMMIHAAILWPEIQDNKLWPLALQHAVHLHNATPSMTTKLSPDEIWSKSRSTHSVLVNAHTWGCPVYVLHPRLQDGGKLPKWEPRSRRAQFVGLSSHHASNVGLVRHLTTKNISPQFHVVYDDLFQTVYASADKIPEIWPDLLRYGRHQVDFDDDTVVELNDEWLSDEELHHRRVTENVIRTTAVPLPPDPVFLNPLDQRATPVHSDWEPNFSQSATPNIGPLGSQNSSSIPSLPVSSTSVIPSSVPMPSLPESLPNLPAPSTPSPSQPSPMTSTAPTTSPSQTSFFPSATSSVGPPSISSRPTRTRRPPTWHKNFSMKLVTTAGIHMLSWMQSSSFIAQHPILLATAHAINVLYDQSYGTIENLPDSFPQFGPQIFKASNNSDPDTPRLHEAMRSSHQHEFLLAMDKEIEELQKHGTWTLIPRSNVPTGKKILPSTWALKVKRYPDGQLRKFKARFCVRGDQQVAGIDYLESYAPVVAWSTVRTLMIIAAQRGWITKQVDFTNAFVHADLTEEVYVDPPEMFACGNSSQDVVLKLDKSLYGLVQAPRCWYHHLRDGLNNLGFKESQEEKGVYYGRGITLVTYVDDVLFFGPDSSSIDQTINDLEQHGFKLTREDTESLDVYSFLGVQVNKGIDANGSSFIRLTQDGLIDKVLEATGMKDCNSKRSPSLISPLGTNANGPGRKEAWSYPSVVGMLMFLGSNAYPEIQFAVHQCARFTHCPRASHEEAIKHICRYLKHAKGHGLTFSPTHSLNVDCYVDADFAGLHTYEDDQDPVCVKSRTGYVITLGNCPILWASKLQTEISLSTTEAEYIALSQSMRELIPLRRLISEISGNMSIRDSDVTIKSTVFEDNNGAIKTATAERMSPRTKHIAVKYHFFRSFIGPHSDILLSKIDTNVQKADIFTKGLSPDRFEHLRRLLCGW